MKTHHIVFALALAASAAFADPIALTPQPTPEPTLSVNVTVTPEQVAALKTALATTLGDMETPLFTTPEGVTLEDVISNLRSLSIAQDKPWSNGAVSISFHDPAYPAPVEPTPTPTPEPTATPEE